jgi:hypothetical protein
MKSFVLMMSLAVTVGAQTNTVGVAGRVVAFNGSVVGGRAVTGMPYSAQQTTEHVQTLADGTRITQPAQQVMLYRDSLGRTRTERTFAPPPGVAAVGYAAPGFIEISDLVGGNHYTL